MGKAKEKTQGAATNKVAEKIMGMNLVGKILLMEKLSSSNNTKSPVITPDDLTFKTPRAEQSKV